MVPPGPIPNPEVKHQHVDGSRTIGPATRLRVSLRSLATPWQAALSGAGGGKCDSGFAYHRRKPAFSYIVDCKWLVSA